jgi:hypothetical protein
MAILIVGLVTQQIAAIEMPILVAQGLTRFLGIIVVLAGGVEGVRIVCIPGVKTVRVLMVMNAKRMEARKSVSV